MNFGDVVGTSMREGLSPQTRSRIEHAIGDGGIGAPGATQGLDQMLGSLFGQGGSAQQSGGLGGLLGNVGRMLSGDSGVGGLSRGQVGGIGALAGALLDGVGSAAKGAIGGSAMAILGTLAVYPA